MAGGNPGADEAVSEDITITALQLAFPEDGVWGTDEEVPLYAAIANTSRTDDALVAVRGEDFGEAVLIGDDGTQGALRVEEDDNLYLEPDGAPSVVLRNLETSLTSGEVIDVTFVFEEAGEVTMPAGVAAEPPGQGDFDAPQDPTPDD
ncbi:copper chaperone PCu(A)C [Blastococcus sp. PRF04-17]|uniref:copper chaperone PCu(A)C n=1 Tax=Blastococcus sp. PRF04-17 TaxID=2933797 RepID=UPI001FF50FF8|nr:copper chaperone PCu(A)C [Blastococcus sp. PRF04-17]UOY00387.1 hypothetical protein MVA48_15420 [Blastococcus sp. PRF04-17]